MSKYVAKLDLEIENDQLKFNILNNPIIINENEITIETDNIQTTRAYLDAFRSLINFIYFNNLPKDFSNKELIKLLSMPPFKIIYDEANLKEPEVTIYQYRYSKILIDDEIKNKINYYREIANNYDEKEIDTNYYYWLLKWFTFCLDELSIYQNENNNLIVNAHPETLFIKFWITFEIITKKNKRNNYNNINRKFLFENEIKELIELLLNIDLHGLDTIRNEIIHEGKIHRNDYSINLPILINYCYDSINEIFKMNFKNENELLNIRNNHWEKK